MLFILNVANFQFGNEMLVSFDKKGQHSCIHRGLEVAFRTDKCFQLFISTI